MFQIVTTAAHATKTIINKHQSAKTQPITTSKYSLVPTAVDDTSTRGVPNKKTSSRDTTNITSANMGKSSGWGQAKQLYM